MGEKQITHQKWQEAITPEKIYVDGKSRWSMTEMSMTRAWIDCIWKSMTREEKER
jgi:hypothetical protein